MTDNQNSIKKLLRKVKRYILPEYPKNDLKSYQKIIELIPELDLYKKSTIKYLKDVAAQKGVGDLGEYYQLLKNNQEELAYLKKNLTFKGTHLFRGSGWENFSENCLSTFSGKEEVKIWCAGCSSGEEVYSVVLSFLDYVPLSAMDILASDYSDELLEKVREGSYFNMHLEEIPEKYQHHVINSKYKFTFDEAIKNKIQTRNINLLLDEYPRGFDIIICRNVIKFFSDEKIAETKLKLVDCLNPDGYIFLSEDPLEAIPEPESHGLTQIGEDHIYQKIA